MSENFAKDPKIEEVAEAFAADIVDFARNYFGETLDFSEQSIEVVESILTKLNESLVTEKPPAEMIWQYSKAFGSYVGEVFRKNRGGDWGIVQMGQEEFPGIQAPGGALFWPWGRVHKRLTEGAENNVLHYYQHITGKS